MIRKTLIAATLGIVATSVAICVAEIATRLVDGTPLTELRLPPASAYPQPGERSLVALARGLPLAEGVDPTWIDVPPPPLRNRTPPDPELLALRRADGGRNLIEADLYRQWNARWVAAWGCKPAGSLHGLPAGRLRSLPAPLFVFDPPEPSDQPAYRHLLGVTTPEGLVTNRFGWRGPEIPLDKPPGTVRVAFIGASTTVGAHDLPFSYPEYVIHWLNLWAERAGAAVRFDGINAGREGMVSTSIAAIVRQELLAAEPDLVVYYEGANQFRFDSLLDIQAAPRTWAYQWPATSLGQAFAALRPYSALLRHLDTARAILVAGEGVEWPKPSYRLMWPAGVDEFAPDITRRDLPLQLPVILGDLESIRTALEGIGAELAVSSFVWLVSDGMRLDPRRHALISITLNRRWWPFRYADMRRMADFQNRVLARYAAAHDLLFVDVAARLPADPELFVDPMHFNREGIRVQAWTVLNAILPRIRERLSEGAWPRPDRTPMREHPGIKPPRQIAGCPPP